MIIIINIILIIIIIVSIPTLFDIPFPNLYFILQNFTCWEACYTSCPFLCYNNSLPNLKSHLNYISYIYWESNGDLFSKCIKPDHGATVLSVLWRFLNLSYKVSFQDLIVSGAFVYCDFHLFKPKIF